MKRLRLACAAFVGWLFVLFNVERVHEPLNLASFVYVIAAVIGVLSVGIKPLGAVPLRWTLGFSMVTLFALKFSFGYPILGQALPITVVEICAIAVTLALAHQIAFRLHRIDKTSAGMITDGPSGQTVSLEAAQSALYLEVRRARQHDRPLAVLSVAANGQGVVPNEKQLLRELERELLDKYTNARIADLLATEAKDHGIVTHCNRHFVVLLPETDRQDAEQMASRLESTVKTALGVKLQIGVSSFPDEEVTLVGLLRSSEAAMRDGNGVEPRTDEGVQTTAAPTPADRPKSSPLLDTAVNLQVNQDTIEERLPNTTRSPSNASNALRASSRRDRRT